MEREGKARVGPKSTHNASIARTKNNMNYTQLMESRHRSNNDGETPTPENRAANCRGFSMKITRYLSTHRWVIFHVDGYTHPYRLTRARESPSCSHVQRVYDIIDFSGCRLFELPATRVLDGGRPTNPTIWRTPVNVKVNNAIISVAEIVSTRKGCEVS